MKWNDRPATWDVRVQAPFVFRGVKFTKQERDYFEQALHMALDELKFDYTRRFHLKIVLCTRAAPKYVNKFPGRKVIINYGKTILYGRGKDHSRDRIVIIIYRAPLWKMIKVLFHELAHAAQMQREHVDDDGLTAALEEDKKAADPEGQLWLQYLERPQEMEARDFEDKLFAKFSRETFLPDLDRMSFPRYIAHRKWTGLKKKIRRHLLDLFRRVLYRNRITQSEPLTQR